MGFLLDRSTVPIEPDTLPALKVCHWYGASLEERIYTLGRFYFLRETLCASLCAFERAPASESRVAFALLAPDGHFLMADVSCADAALYVLPSCPAAGLRQAPGPALGLSVARSVGADEQGWYWRADFSVSSRTLCPAGGAGEALSFSAALFKYTRGGVSYGASCPIASPGAPLGGPYEPFLVPAI